MATVTGRAKVWLPTGGNLTDSVWRARHRGLRALLVLHLPLLLGLGLVNQGRPGRDTLGYSTVQLLLECAPVVVLFLVSVKGSRRVQAGLVGLGLAWCSIVTVHLSGGSPAAHFHFFVMLAAVTVYQDWTPWLTFLGAAVVLQAVAAAVDTGLVFDQAVQRADPVVWTLIDVLALLAEAVALVVFWQISETEQERSAALAVELGNAELVRARDQSEQRRAASELLTNLARRNQGLLSRQLAKIDQLEQAETDAGQLAELFTLDHLATRMRRNAESLLVLSGEEPPRRWSEPVALSEVVRGAIAEVEDYTRADVLLQQDVAVVGRAVGDMVHLLAELIENATSFSAPSTRVVVSGGRGQTGGFIVSVADSGVSMGDAELSAVNRRLASVTSDVGLTLSGMLGFHVVARLAGRYGVRVWLTRGSRSGLVAMVALPDELLAPVPAATAPDQPYAHAPQQQVYATAGAPGPLLQQQYVPAQAAPPTGERVEALYVPTEPAWEPTGATQPPLHEPAAEPAAQPVAQTTSGGLARRVRGASLAPQIAGSAGESVAQPAAVEPERARSLLTAYTSGLAQGRAAAEPTASGTTDEEQPDV